LSFKLNKWVNLRIFRHKKRVDMFFNSRRVASDVTPGDNFISNLHTILYVGKADQLILGKE
jgi:hypothetical protein